ncbi:MAG: hypothetical protein JST84_07455 [Acidobacteria bacterium]|nr:hypothetical protein [Acidobacteriota bacterium]
MRFTYVFLFSFFLVIQVSPQRRSEDTLDLTKNRPAAKSESSGKIGGGLSGGSNETNTPIPFKITMLDIDKDSYNIGDKLVYSILLENTSKTVITIPWSPAPLSTQPHKNDVTAIISLVIRDDQFGNQFIGAEKIYGYHNASTSLKRLRPGQQVRIRLPGNWWFTDSRVYQKVIKALPQRYAVRVAINIFDNNGNALTSPIFSNNSETIELKKRQP